jgi:uncharacterized protein DUF5010
MSPSCRPPAVAVALLAATVAMNGGDPAGAQAVRNAGKYGAMFSWWYEGLPPQTLDPPTVEWDARTPAWWSAMVRQATYARLGWVAAACWGQNTNADPAMLDPLLRAIDAQGGSLKVALFDDTTSEVLRKNQAKHGVWSLTPPFDLADLEGGGEGGFHYFYDQQWKRYFATVPDRYSLKVNGRPVVFMWVGVREWYANPSAFHSLLGALRAATRRDFGVDPFIIPEESWRRLDPSARPDALYDWFEPTRTIWTLTSFGGIAVGHLIPGFNCLTCDPPHPVVSRENGALLRAGLDAIAPRSDLVLLEGLVNVDENAEVVETTTWGRLYLNILRYYATVVP